MHHPIRRSALAVAVAVALGLASLAAQAQTSNPLGLAGAQSNGKLLLTGGVASIDGAAGGGLTPWAVTGSYATDGAFGISAHLSRVKTQDYALTGYGAAFSFGERFELSLAQQDFDTAATGAALGLPGLHLKQTILGAKLRVAGDAVLNSDTLMPQVAVGVQFKDLNAAGLAPTLTALGAKTNGVDVYISATKLFLAQGILLNATLRATQANQNGLLGFGGTAHSGYSVQPEVSVAWLLRKNLALGAEYRFKPDNLNPSVMADGLREDDWKDIFIAWAPSKKLSLTLAWVDLGHIVPAVIAKRQSGAYLSAQLAF